MPNVLLVAADQLPCLDWLGEWLTSRPGFEVTLTAAASLREAASSIPSTAPVLVLAPSLELPELDVVVNAVREHQRRVVLTLIFVHPAPPEHFLLVHEWDQAGGAFSQRRCSPEHLQREIELVLERCRVPAEVCRRVRGIGFYDCLNLQGQTYHVQTEVAGRTEPRIRTTVHCAGSVISTALVPWPPGLSGGEAAEAAEAVVREQHQQFVLKVRSRPQG